MEHCLIRYTYNLFTAISWPFVCLYYLLRSRTDGKYRSSYKARLGLTLPAAMPSARRIWIHALSVGETLSAIPLVEALSERFPKAEIVFSTATESGRDIARKRLSGREVASVFHLPHDFPWAMEMIVRRVAPSIFILIETDIWPNLLHALNRHGVSTVLVNARLSPKSFRRQLPFRRLIADVLGQFDLIFVQSRDDRERYLALGAPEARVHTAGNLKFDAASVKLPELRLTALRKETGIGEDRLAWLAGSTHEGEEEILLDIHGALRRRHPDLLLIVAPRHIGRAPRIESLCARLGLPSALRSRRGSSARSKAVYIVDTLGELVAFYALARYAFIGGSLVPFGGHNPLEAVAQGKPALWGPHLFNFREIEAQLVEAGCGTRIESGEDLLKTLQEWLQDPRLSSRLEDAARTLFSTHAGCSKRIAERLSGLMG